MNLITALHALFVDLRFQAAVTLISLDFGFGVAAALKQGVFKLSYLADFARNDVAFKLAPWAFIYVASKFAGGQQIVIPGIDLGVIEIGFYGVITLAWSGSLLASFRTLGIPVAKALPRSLNASENADFHEPPKPKRRRK